MIEQPSLDKLAQWRGDDNEEPDAMEEILREVIVIPDDDEDDNGQLTSSSTLRQSSVEMISSRAIADDVETRPIDYAARRTSAAGVESPDTDDDQEVTFLGHGQYVFDRSNEKRISKDGTHRLRAWEEARSRLRHPQGGATATDVRPLTEISGPSTNSGHGAEYWHSFQSAPQRARPTDTQGFLFPPKETQVTMSSAQEKGARYEMEQNQNHNNTDRHGRVSVRPLLCPPHRCEKSLTVQLRTQHANYMKVSHPLSSSNHFKPAEAKESGQPNRREPHHPADARPVDTMKRRLVLGENINQNRVSTLHMRPTTPRSPRLLQYEMQSPSQAHLRFETIAQSIESPTQVKPAEIHSDRVSYLMPSSSVYHPEDMEMQDTSTYRRVHQTFGEGSQATKRRRFEAVDKERPIQRDRPDDLQETLLIPIGHTDKHDSVVRRNDVLEPAGRAPRLHDARPVQSFVYMDKRNAPVYQSRPTESNRGVSYTIDSPRHRQFLISPQQPQFHTFSATAPVKVLPERLPTENQRHGSLQNSSYGPAAQYVSLPREVPRTSNVVASGSERGAAQNSSSIRAPQTSFGEAPPSRGHWLQREGSPRIRQEMRFGQPEHYYLQKPTAAVHVDRPRGYLPLERSFDELRPVVKSTSSSSFVELKYPIAYNKEPVYIESRETVSRTRPPHQQEDSRHAEPSMFLQHDVKREPFQASTDNDTW